MERPGDIGSVLFNFLLALGEKLYIEPVGHVVTLRHVAKSKVLDKRECNLNKYGEKQYI